MKGQTLEHRFWSKVDKTEDCWLWTGALSWGYGVFYVNKERKLVRATHVSYELATGERVPVGKVMCHKCDNPPCVRPEHIFPGTPSENLQDMVEKGRCRSGDKPGSRNANAKLLPAHVQFLRDLSSRGMSQRNLAALFHISPGHVHRIVHGIRWRAEAMEEMVTITKSDYDRLKGIEEAAQALVTALLSSSVWYGEPEDRLRAALAARATEAGDSESP